MAEFVQYRTEQTISELEQMQRIELFSKEEIRLIAAKRKRYEYKMQRMNKSKDTYLRYIQYELDLIRLIKLRREKTQIFFKESEIESVIRNRISGLFYRALANYKSDIKLWMSHIRFCMQFNMKSTISGILVRMLAVHNDKVKVWKFAVNWEFEQNESIETARKLMLRGLRFHPNSKSLYKAYLRLELNYAESRRRILIEKDKLSNDLILAEIELLEKKWEDVNGKTRESIEIELEKKRKSLGKLPKHELKTKLAEIIIDSTLMRFQDVQKLVEICGEVQAFSLARPLQKKILQKLHQRFPSNELVYDFQAMLALTRSSKEGCCRKVYSEALDKVPTEKMWSLYLETLSSVDESNQKKNLLKKELKRCHNLGLLNEKFYPTLVMLLLDSEDKSALPTLLKALELFPENGDLHHLLIRIHLSNGNDDSALSAFKRAEAVLGNNNLDMLKVYKTIIQHYENANFALADKFFKKSLFTGGNVSSELKPCYLQWIYDKKGIDTARAEYKTMLLVPPLCLKFHEKMVNLEMMQPEPNMKTIRLCYEMASQQFGEKDPDLWMKFIMFELGKGDPKRAPLVYSQAKARLAPDLLNGFVTQYTLDRSNGKV